MSKSRLEKFLYALYSLDSSDLPNPLSRIEELYECLVTGEEVPTFEPLSRVEKYLMAILGVYDVELLPNPLSRVEVLLHKLATGDDNLDDVKSFLSEHEELLAEIIRNGGAGGNIDIEYVLYTLSTEFNTLYNTAEKPVKSAILKGNTLVNLSPFKSLMDVTPSVLNENSVIWYSVSKEYFDKSIFKPNTKYIVKFGLGTPSRFKGTYISGLNMPNKNGYYTEHNDVFTTPQTISPEGGNMYFKGIDGDVITKEEYSKIEVMIIEYQDGMENWDIPYFEGMQSVKMPVLTTTGKNLLDPSSVELVVENANSAQTVTYDSVADTYEFLCPNSFNQMNIVLKNLYKVTSANQVYVSGTYESDGETHEIGGRFFVNEDKVYMGIIHNWKPVTKANLKIMITSDNSATTTAYEPFKSNILTVNEPVELRGIGDIQDTLDLMTGEVTQRIGEVVLDGSEDEDWGRNGSLSNGHKTSFFTIGIDNVKRGIGNITKKCDKFIAHADYSHLNDIEGVHQVVDNQISIRVLKTSLSDDSSEGLKAYLRHNPITIQYRFITESIKTVDLSTVNQDGNDTKLSTFNDITHVTLSSEGLIPEAELEVATKNEEVLNTMSLEMDDISKTQNGLQETLDTQSENVDSTMIATTEIYEGLL